MTDEKQTIEEAMQSDVDDSAEVDDQITSDVTEESNEDLSSSVKGLEEQVAGLKDQLLRSVAELDNYRKRSDREKDQMRKFGIANFAKELLSAADNLRRALDAGPSNLEGTDESVKNLIVGVELTEKELLSAFEKNGIRKIEPLGEKFDYNFHQAMFEVESSDQEAGTVVQVLQPGYAIEDRVLRAAMVGVSKSIILDQSERVDTTV
jgi:molecular chaperone GrpE